MVEVMVQALENMIRRFCAYGLELKDSDGFTHDLFTLIPSLELANKTSVHSSTVEVDLSGELENKHPTFPVSVIKSYKTAYKEFFPLRNPTPSMVPPVEHNKDKKIKKFIKEYRTRGKNKREYLVRYRNSVHEDEWLAESDIPDSDELLRRFRHERRPKA
ncbi:hypothetical protein O181_048238 [Austropuccinia psidii MF-1]|uniref:Chromo domain-containing protein n=1 Tax=Austropuccinia psidii MF-1 TaxID=1389203 RepID=A0A9Q3HKA4_9BASI|nr:hypothetical protein [Austropuccinia psidii MF-1]